MLPETSPDSDLFEEDTHNEEQRDAVHSKDPDSAHFRDDRRAGSTSLMYVSPKPFYPLIMCGASSDHTISIQPSVSKHVLGNSKILGAVVSSNTRW